MSANVEETASRLVRVGDSGDGPSLAYLLVVQNDSSSIFHLPRMGSIVVGRGSDVELRVEHASVSRRHATIRIEEGIVRIADLGSHNGTRVNGELVEGSRVLASGDVATLGEVVLVVHFAAPAPVTRASYGEAGWRRRLAEELVRAVTFKRSLVIGALVGIDAAAVELGNTLRLIDVVGTADDGQVLVLLPEIGRAPARELLARLLQAAPGSRAGIAECPTDACDADTLLLAARSAARRARPGTVADAAESVTQIDLASRHVLIADPAMARVFALLERIAPTELSVLITGETGVGKENAAYAVHHWSKRTGPFVAVNCAALGPESLVDSELFGHDKGAFTGAITAKAGLFENASGGTVFLDEIGELPLATQAKLLRALETKTVTRLGEVRERAIDVRVVSATNRSLEVESAADRFRKDLYFRLAGATVVIPPLRDRRCEVPLLARAFLADACTRASRSPMTITPDAMQVLLTYGWPGNIRELKHTMEFAMAAAPDDIIEPSDLPERLAAAAGVTPAVLSPVMDAAAPEGRGSFRPISDEIRDLERKRMSEALTAAGGVKTRAAQLIDMPIRTFTLKLKQYKL